MKKQIYYFSFALLGALFGFFVHMVVEIWYIQKLLTDFERYSLGLDWSGWEKIHAYGTLGLVVVLGMLGYRCGVKFWRLLYIEKRYSKRWGIKLKENF